DYDAADHARHAEPDHAPVVARVPAAPGLPAVHPLAAIGIDVVLPLGGARAQEVLLVGEELVVARDRGATEILAREIGQLEKIGHSSAPRSVVSARPRSAILRPRRNVA